MHQLKEALFGKVEAVLDPSVAPEGADTPVPLAVNTGRWRAVFDKGVRFWSRRGGARGAEARDEVQRQLEDLHADIQGQISAEASVGRLKLRRKDVAQERSCSCRHSCKK